MPFLRTNTAIFLLLVVSISQKRFFAHAGDNYTIPWQVSLQRLPPGSGGTLGFATIFTEAASTIVGYAGIVTGVEPNLFARTCNATNGCGVHIHNGTSCDNSTTQGGHYYVKTSAVTVDPWINARYSSDVNGKANFQGVLDIGTNDVNGRVFIVHSQNGTRIACGIIEAVDTTENFKFLSTETENLTSSGVSSQVTTYSYGSDTVCYFGKALQLEPNLVSYLNNNPVGTNCNFTNGCGVHVHEGYSCFNRTTQGGHLYSAPVDPWLYTMYHSTSASGSAYFTGCVETGVPEVPDSRAFVIHSDNGTRVSCGLLTTLEAPEPPLTIWQILVILFSQLLCRFLSSC